MSASQSTDSILHRLEVVADHLRSIADLAGQIRGRNARAVVSEAQQALAALGFEQNAQAALAVAVGAAVGRAPDRAMRP